MKAGLIGGAALMAAVLTPLAVTVVGAAAPRQTAVAVLETPVTTIQTMREIERERGVADAEAAAPPPAATSGTACSRPVRVVGTGYGEPIVCR